MDWLDHHRESERLSFRAGDARRSNDLAAMSRLLRQSAAAEEKALHSLTTQQPKTWGITAVSVASLYLQSGDLSTAEHRALQFLLSERASDSTRIRLREVLGLIWAEQRRIEHPSNGYREAIVVELDGDEPSSFGIPLNVMISSAQHLKTSIYRTAESRKALPYEQSAQRRAKRSSACDLKVIGIDEYGEHYSVLIQEPGIWQSTLDELTAPQPVPLVENFFDIAIAAIESPATGLPDLIPDPAYREGILKSFHALAPGGHPIEFMSVCSSDESRHVDLDPDTKRGLLVARRQLRERELADKLTTVTIHGVLIGLDLPNGSIKVRSDGGDQHDLRVGKTVVLRYLEQLEDRQVEIHVAQDKRGQLLFRGLIPDQGQAN